MIKNISINNFKSINRVDLELGRLNVFIGENGAGKSNVLEAIAFAGAACSRKLDNEFLASRGIRVTAPSLMQSAFEMDALEQIIEISTAIEKGTLSYKIKSSGDAYSKWDASPEIKINSQAPSHSSDSQESLTAESEDFMAIFPSFLASNDISRKDKNKLIAELLDSIKTNSSDNLPLKASITFDEDSVFGKYFNSHKEVTRSIRRMLSGFIIYSPENTSLREFSKEGQILPLGINGEGLVKLLEVEFKERGKEYEDEINKFLSVFGWFQNLKFVDHDSVGFSIEVSDRYICSKDNSLDIKGANEGFLFLMFYFALFTSSYTPSFFAIDNIDASLNPKLCRRLVEQLSRLSEQCGKQVILTTHNPAVLDGINLEDDNQRLFIISRDDDGSTELRRARKPRPAVQAPPIKLSEAFLRGSLGGLPKGF